MKEQIILISYRCSYTLCTRSPQPLPYTFLLKLQDGLNVQENFFSLFTYASSGPDDGEGKRRHEFAEWHVA